MSKKSNLKKTKQPNLILVNQNNHLRLINIKPLTENQKIIFSDYNKGKNLFLHGSAGTGKTFLSLYLSLKTILDTRQYKKIIIIRSTVPSRDMGFLPGSVKDKQKVYESPYRESINELFERGDAYDILRNKGMIDFISTSFIRGTTFNNAIVIADEIQNFEWNELFATITRFGNNCKLICSGDIKQKDLKFSDNLIKFTNVIKHMKDFSFIELNSNDIVRSDLVKDFIIQAEQLGYL